MAIQLTTYIPGASPIHSMDARIKIIALLVYSITLFFIDTWWAMALFALVFVAVFLLSRLPGKNVFGIVIPVYLLAALAVVFNAFVFISEALPVIHEAPIPLIGEFAFTFVGFQRGCFFALRILLLVFASLVVTYTTSAEEMMAALESFLGPLRHIGVPVDDVVMVFSIALRFIPVTAEEFNRVRDAQWSRGASFYEGSFGKRLCAWKSVFIPVLVGLFRRADRLARAMDARCFGATNRRTSLHEARLSASGVLMGVLFSLFCIVVAIAG